MVRIVKKKRSKERQKGVRILIVFVVLIVILSLFIIGGGQQTNPEKFAPQNPNLPVHAPCKSREGGANLTRFNLSNPCSLTIEDFSEVVRQWVHDNATMEEVMLAIKLWQANGSANPGR